MAGVQWLIASREEVRSHARIGDVIASLAARTSTAALAGGRSGSGPTPAARADVRTVRRAHSCALPDGYSLLVLPNPNELRSAQAGEVAAFRARAGAVLANDPAWAWSDPAGTAAAAAAFRAALKSHLRTVPLQVSGGPAGRYAVSYQKPGRLLVAVTNDFSWVQFSTLKKPIPKNKINPTPPAAEGVQIRWRQAQGLPEPQSPTPRPHRLHAIEAVCRTTLTVHEDKRGYRVDLPPLQFMALLVVTHDWPLELTSVAAGLTRRARREILVGTTARPGGMPLRDPLESWLRRVVIRGPVR